eukprot:72287-Hanusia_phi.AAC.3
MIAVKQDGDAAEGDEEAGVKGGGVGEEVAAGRPGGEDEEGRNPKVSLILEEDQAEGEPNGQQEIRQEARGDAAVGDDEEEEEEDRAKAAQEDRLLPLLLPPAQPQHGRHAHDKRPGEIEEDHEAGGEDGEVVEEDGGGVAEGGKDIVVFVCEGEDAPVAVSHLPPVESPPGTSHRLPLPVAGRAFKEEAGGVELGRAVPRDDVQAVHVDRLRVGEEDGTVAAVNDERRERERRLQAVLNIAPILQHADPVDVNHLLASPSAPQLLHREPEALLPALPTPRQPPRPPDHLQEEDPREEEEDEKERSSAEDRFNRSGAEEDR